MGHVTLPSFTQFISLKDPVAELMLAKWRNSLGMCLLSGYHLVQTGADFSESIWERCCLCFSCLRQWCTSWSWCVYLHRTFIIFRAMVSTHKKNDTQFTLGLCFACQTPKEWSKLGIPHRFRDEVWWSGKWTVHMKESNSSCYNPADIFCASPPSLPTFMSHYLPQFKNRTSSSPFPLGCPFDLDIFTTFLFYATFLGKKRGWSHQNRGPKTDLSPGPKTDESYRAPNRETNQGYKHLKESAKKTHMNLSCEIGLETIRWTTRV